MRKVILALAAWLGTGLAWADVTGVVTPTAGGGNSGSGPTSVAVVVPAYETESASGCSSSGSCVLTIAAATGQTTHQVVGTGSTGTVGLETLTGPDLPTPGASSLGGIESASSVSHEWVSYIDTAGVQHQSQPACADLSTAAASCSTDATNAANISSGTLPAARMPLGLTSTPSAGQFAVGNSGGTGYGLQTLSGDCTLASTGAITCTKTNGTAFSALATASTAAIANGGTGTNTAPSSAQIMVAQSSTAYAPKSVSGDCTTSSAGAFTCDTVLGGSTPATVATQTFTGTLTGMSSATTGTITYRVVGNVAYLKAEANILGTSNADTMTMTGLPAAVQPTHAAECISGSAENGGNAGYAALGVISAGGSTLTLAVGQVASSNTGYGATGWATSAGKGIVAGWECNYSLD